MAGRAVQSCTPRGFRWWGWAHAVSVMVLIGEAAETALVAAAVGWSDLRDMDYFGGTSPRLSFGLSDGNELA